MLLYDYSKSTAAYRVRIALGLKGLSYQRETVSLLDKHQQSDAYRSLNPAGLVPTLVDGDVTLSQSLAIIEYLDERYPQVKLLPSDPVQKAQCRSLALDIACDVHPLNNLRVLQYLTGPFGHSDDDKITWYHHWLKQGFDGLEAKLQGLDSPFIGGEAPNLADICLVPQLFNARRFAFDLTAYPTLTRIEAQCQTLDAFIQAHPDKG
ncbi:maleylacetoacetate isomerase [Salinivibrio kushneri]|uniref:Maleylacetoacetate isomerase n=1 Tax=Salinivibrio kushneri TaxID=1908198 RepID=A0AB36JV81_9GAMM|nr:maleylacetoacetate isomerase [Salinivibrio kushneri]OOE38624.1 maleylacetoacetate isomerase [Salinivibrio kushneri]QCP03048.1 maleylacetoacetate isomerase [Salinivibrio kushneri]